MLSSFHVTLLTADIARSTAFYRGIGFTEAFRVPATGEPVHVELELDGHRLGLATVAAARDDHGFEPVLGRHRAVVVLWTDDVAADLARLIELGATPLAEPRAFLGLTVATVEDPDGHAVQLVQPAAPAE